VAAGMGYPYFNSWHPNQAVPTYHKARELYYLPNG
jgi:hypothetical protein